MNNINFTANLVQKTTIEKRAFLFNKNIDANIVEFDPKDNDDFNVFKDTTEYWSRNGGRYAAHMFSRLYENVNYKIPSYINEQHFYALTTQKENFDKLNKESILGLMVFSETDKPDNKIEYLQVNPFTNKSNNSKRPFKNVGKQLVRFVQSHFKNKGIYLYSDNDAIDFYRKLDFEKPFSDNERMEWKA